MALPRVTSQYTPSPTGAPTSASQRVLAIIGEGSTTFTVTEEDTRFGLLPPASQTLTVMGTAGTATWTYVITAANPGGESVASAGATTSSGNAVLSNTNYNALSWTAIPGATGYNVYRTVEGDSPATLGLGLIGQVTGLTFSDTGIVATDPVPVGSTDTLAHPPLVITRVGNFQTTTDYALGTDYVLGPTGIVWLAGHGPAADAVYWTTYTYAKVASDYVPMYFSGGNLGPIISQYGPITSVISPGTLDPASQLSMAAQIAMDPGIGASQLILCQITPATPGAPTLADFQAALLKLQQPVAGIKPYYIVPLIGNLADGSVNPVIAACFAHCIQMADPQFLSERRCYAGLKNNSTYNSLISALQGFNAINNCRLTIACNYDPQLSIVSNNAALELTLDGSYVAVALAAYRSTQQVSLTELNVIIPVFDDFVTVFNPVQMDTMDDNGGMVLESFSGVVTTANDVTVDISSDIEKSIPTVETRDDMISGLRNELRRQVLGQRGSPTVPSEIEDIADLYLTTRVASGDILAFAPSSAFLNPGSITKYTVSFSYKPAGEVLDILINFTIDLSLA